MPRRCWPLPARWPAPPPPVPAVGAPQYGYPPPQQPSGVPTVGPGYQAVLRYRAPDGSEQQLIRRSAPGTPHPEWQMLHELRAMNVPPQQVLELHTELESCELPGGYCARMIRETWPQVRITSVAPYGRDHASRQQGMRHLLDPSGRVAPGRGRSGAAGAGAGAVAARRRCQPVPPVPPEGIGQELAQAFGPQGIFRFDQRAVVAAGRAGRLWRRRWYGRGCRSTSGRSSGRRRSRVGRCRRWRSWRRSGGYRPRRTRGRTW